MDKQYKITRPYYSIKFEETHIKSLFLPLNNDRSCTIFMSAMLDELVSFQSVLASERFPTASIARERFLS